MAEKWLTTDASVEAVSSLEVLAEQLQLILSDSNRWKWGVLALHSSLQGMMVLSLQSFHGLHTLRKEDAERWLDTHERGGPYPHDLKLDDFLGLYRKIKSDKMLMYFNSQKFSPKGTQGSSVKLLNRLRNEFVHFTPRVWALELDGLPNMAEDCLEIIKFLAWKFHNITFHKQELDDRARKAFESAHRSLAMLRKGT